jgi:hypothetical protein
LTLDDDAGTRSVTRAVNRSDDTKAFLEDDHVAQMRASERSG